MNMSSLADLGLFIVYPPVCRRGSLTPSAFRGPDFRWKTANKCHPPKLPVTDDTFGAALDLFTGDLLRRSELEARILANQTALTIADRMGIPVDVVATFEFWFLDVRTRLEHSSWICHQVIRRCPTGVLGQHDLPVLWRWAGYHCGSFILEPLLTVVDHRALSRQGIDAYLSPEVPLPPTFKLWLVAERMPIPRTAREWKQLERLVKCYNLLTTTDPVPPTELMAPLVSSINLTELLSEVIPTGEATHQEASPRTATPSFAGASRDAGVEDLSDPVRTLREAA